MTDDLKLAGKRRRWWSISVRGLMLLVLVIGGAIGWEVNRVARMWRIVGFLELDPDASPEERLVSPRDYHEGHRHNHGDDTADAAFDDEYSGGSWNVKPQPAWLPEWVREAVGKDHFRQVSMLQFSRRPTPKDWDAIEALGSVQSLNFASEISDDDLIRLVSCPNLRELWLSSSEITDKTLVGVGSHQNLRTLSLEYAAKVTADGLAPLANLTQLEALYLPAGAGSDTAFRHLEGLKNLKKLEVSHPGSGLTDLGLSSLRGMTQLEELDIAARRIGDEGLAALASLPCLKSLTIRRASESQADPAFSLSKAGVEQWGRLTRVEFLRLEAPDEMDDAWVGQIGRLPRLRDVVIESPHVTDAGLIALGAATSLKSLSISSPLVTDAGLEHLRTLSQLYRLQLDAPVSEAGVAALRAALPNLKVSNHPSGRRNSPEWKPDDPAIKAASPP